MRICVPWKRSPDSAARIRLAPDGKRIDGADLKFAPGPYDEMALEEALRLQEKHGPGEVVVLSVGPLDAQAILRQALAMGADRAIHLQHDGMLGLELDGLQTARALAAAMRALSPELILLGKMAIDDQSSQVGVLLAAELGIPAVCEVVKAEWTGGRFRFHQQVDGELLVVEAAPPVLATATKGLNEPRYPGIKGILAAKKKPLEVQPAATGPASLEILRLEAPPARKPGRIVGEGPAAVGELVRLLREEAKVI